MNIADTVAQLILSKSLVTQAVDDLKVFIASDTATIEERWDVYLLIEGDLPSCDGFRLDTFAKDMGKEENRVCYYDDFNMDRGVNKSFSDMIDQHAGDACDESPEYKAELEAFCTLHGVDRYFRTEDHQIGKEWRIEQVRKYGNKFPLFREAIMQSGFGSTQDDW